MSLWNQAKIIGVSRSPKRTIRAAAKKRSALKFKTQLKARRAKQNHEARRGMNEKINLW